MKAYKTIRFTEAPDIGDIKEEGRASHVGKLAGRSGEYRPYTRSASARRATRRTLKRADKARFEKLNKEGD